MDLVAGRVLAVLLVKGAAAYSRGARVGWRRDSCTFGLGGMGEGSGSSSWNGFPIFAGLLHDGHPLEQLTLPQLEQLRGPQGINWSSTQPILRTVFGMMHSSGRQQGSQQAGAHELQLLQPHPS